MWTVFFFGLAIWYTYGSALCDYCLTFLRVTEPWVSFVLKMASLFAKVIYEFLSCLIRVLSFFTAQFDQIAIMIDGKLEKEGDLNHK